MNEVISLILFVERQISNKQPTISLLKFSQKHRLQNVKYYYLSDAILMYNE